MDDRLRDLENRYQSGDFSILPELISLYRRLNVDASDLEIEFLKDEVMRYQTLWNTGWAYRPRTEAGILFPAELIEAKNKLIAKAQEIGLSPSHHLYRRYDIPDTNDHLERMAVVHNSFDAYAGRDDDSYFGNCKFKTKSDAENFLIAVNRHHQFFADSIRIVQDSNGNFIVSWHSYK